MNCPYCGAEMQEGYLFAGQGARIIWTEKSARLMTLPKGSDVVVESGSMLKGPDHKAYHCANCEKIVVEY